MPLLWTVHPTPHDKGTQNNQQIAGTIEKGITHTAKLMAVFWCLQFPDFLASTKSFRLTRAYFGVTLGLIKSEKHMAYIDWNIVASLIDSDPRVADIVEALRGVNRSSLSGLSTLYSRVDGYRRETKGSPTIHGCGFVLRCKDDQSDEIWLTVSGCWSGSWQIRVLVGTSPFGFGASGTEVARLELSKAKYDKAMQLLNAPWTGVDKEALLEKHGHKLKKFVASAV